MGIVIRRNGTDTDRGLRPGPIATGHGDQRQRFQNGQHRLATPRGAVLYKPANARPKAVVPPHGSEYAAIYSRIAKLIHEATGSSCFAATGGVARGADLFEQRVLGLNAG